MITLFSAVLSALCAGCVDPDRPMGLRLGVPEPTVTTYTDGCARFQIRFDDGVAQVTSTMPPAAPCLQGDLYLFTDTAAVLDPVAGRLRIGVKLENRGTVPIVIPVRLRFNADSVILLNANQTPYGVPSDLLATNADSVDATGRQAKWFMDMSLAPAGQPQVLMPGATTVRRWLEFGGTTWAPRVRIKVQLFGAQGQNVPAMAPDSRPAALMDMSRIHTPSQGFPFARDLLVVRFFPGTSLAERTAAIHQVNGVVAGGYPDPTSEGGAYLVKLPADSTLTTITQAEAVLRSRQSVRFVWKHHLLEVVPSYIRPTDGQGWERSTWRPGGDLLLTPNPLIDSWGIQFVRAPLAWGCSLGDTAARVGFVDYGFQTNVPDLPSSYFSINGANLTGDTLRHGTRVLSVVGAIGNNGTRMAGLAWRARFGFRDPTHVDSLGKPAVNPSTGRRAGYFEDALLNIGALADSGVQVINISLGADSVPVIDLLDTVATDRMRGYAGAVAGRLRFGGRTPPVLVVAAGNVPQGDPRGSLFPFLKDSLRDHVIVVAAMKRDGGLQNAPSGSAYIDVVAPGEDIYVIDELADWSVGGASYATPIVTGIAALLKSFDPTLSTDSLRLLIIEGANRSGKVSGGYPVADAYESLKLAAGRTGAPICGNVVLSQYASITGGNTTVKVRRQAGQPYETIASFTLPADTSVSIDVVHGGKQLVRTVPGTPVTWQLVAQHNGTGWQSLSPPWATIPTPSITGSSNSWHGWSHDADSILHMSIAPNPGFQTANLTFNIYTGGVNRPALFSFVDVPNRYVDPATGFTVFGGAGALGTIAPSGEFALVAIHSASSLGTLNFHKVALPTGSKSALFSDASQAIVRGACQGTCGQVSLQSAYSLGISEDGSEFWYLVPTVDPVDFTAGCALKRYSLRTSSFVSIDNFTGTECNALPLGSARLARVPVTTR